MENNEPSHTNPHKEHQQCTVGHSLPGLNGDGGNDNERKLIDEVKTMPVARLFSTNRRLMEMQVSWFFIGNAL